ncbi:prephenate dehydratase [Allosaccharopolyspora coralli]|uniref:Prephenate dehydratase n=1 Tax=Allosaccharopolyspora coralli TaxID=2665642 RepID=A0A5Q3Q0W8_9PSEU|nr:prephenate dehydratase [Allosaccharopolyspora coralli]QGK68268.1 prephenate dehydratase [Allosaccharopolyspora coralli]
MPRITYLGPPGTFTEQATRALAADAPSDWGPGAELVPTDSVAHALAQVRSGAALAAGVPVENSVEGSVSATLDALTVGDPLVAVSEHVLPIRFTVLARKDTALQDVRTIASHPHALAQVRQWINDTLSEPETLIASSTAAAADDVLAERCDAAVVAPVATEYFPGLVPLVTDVADVTDAVTRFLMVTRPGTVPGPTGADRTSVAAVITDDVGALTDLLAELSLRGINLSRIESRPTKDRLGEYRFFLDFDGHVTDARVGDALAGLYRRCTEVRFLGSYPRADGAAASVRPVDSEEAFDRSARWLSDVRAGRLA